MVKARYKDIPDFIRSRVILVKELRDEVSTLKEKLAEYKKAIKAVIEGWDSLPEGNHSPSEVQKWLVEKMQPAIFNLRTLLKKEKSDV